MANQPKPAKTERVERVSYLDQALWTKLGETSDPEDFARFWLTLQCRMISGVSRGTVLLGPAGSGLFRPLAVWPEGESDPADLLTAAERALKERRGVGYERPGRSYFAAYPFVFEGCLHGVVAVEVSSSLEDGLRAVMQQLQWGAFWIEVVQRRQSAAADQATKTRTVAALDLVATVVEEERFGAACMAAATEMAARLDCDRASVGFLRGYHAGVAAVSHSAKIGGRMNLVRMIGAAMDEAIDQEMLLRYPTTAGGANLAALAHADLARVHGAGAILTVPFTVNEDFLGAFTFERPAGMGFDHAAVELCECVAAVVGPILEEKRLNDRLLVVKAIDTARRQFERLIGPRHWGRKLAAVAAALLIGFFAVARDEYRVTAEAVLEGRIQRVVVAPFDGFINSRHARAGDRVAKGDVLAALDDTELSLKRLRWAAALAQRVKEFDQAFAERDRAQINIINAQIAQAEAQIALVEGQLARVTVAAPFDGVVVAGDLRESVGASVERGQILFKVAPLDAYRIVLEVDESDIADIHEGQTGTLVLSSVPNEPLSFAVVLITPVSEAADGRTYFRVEADLEQVSPRLRPGMEGVGKVSMDRRRVIWIWTHGFFEWLRLTVWSWWP